MISGYLFCQCVFFMLFLHLSTLSTFPAQLFLICYSGTSHIFFFHMCIMDFCTGYCHCAWGQIQQISDSLRKQTLMIFHWIWFHSLKSDQWIIICSSLYYLCYGVIFLSYMLMLVLIFSLYKGFGVIFVLCILWDVWIFCTWLFIGMILQGSSGHVPENLCTYICIYIYIYMCVCVCWGGGDVWGKVYRYFVCVREKECAFLFSRLFYVPFQHLLVYVSPLLLLSLPLFF